MSGSKNLTVHKTNMIPALTECLRLNCSEIHMGINQWVLRQGFIWLKMTITIIPLVWKLIFLKDISRASSSLHVHLVLLYCYCQINVFFPSTNLTLFESSIIKLSHLLCPSFAFKKPPFQSFQSIAFSSPSFHLYCKIYTCDSPSIQVPDFLELFYYYPSLTLVSHYKLFLSILNLLLPAIIPSCGLMILRSIIKITALQTSPPLRLF